MHSGGEPALGDRPGAGAQRPVRLLRSEWGRDGGMNKGAEASLQHCSPRLSQCLLGWHSLVTPDTLLGVFSSLRAQDLGLSRFQVSDPEQWGLALNQTTINQWTELG